MSIGSRLWKMSKRMSRQNLAPFIHKAVRAAPDGGDVLNIGAGGEVAVVVGRAARGKSLRMTSVDVDPARKPDLVLDICESTYEDAFDLVVMAEVLEHIPRPHVALERVLRALRPGGVLLLTTPFIFPLHDRPHDYFRYTRHGLDYLLRDYAEVRIAERNGWAEAVLVLLARTVAEPRIGRWMTAACVCTAAVLHPLARMVSRFSEADGITTGYLVTARKPAQQENRHG